MKILAIESSCDETAAAVVEDGRKVLSNVIASQVEEHKIYGGVVPEIASRRHTEAICGVVEKALSDADCTINDIDAIAADLQKEVGLCGQLRVVLVPLDDLNFVQRLQPAAEIDAPCAVAVFVTHCFNLQSWLPTS